jgi:hypothetical protein
MRHSIALVGCGFLGSLFAEEMAKRQFAFNDNTEWTLIDFDKIEERNAANQNFTRTDDGKRKTTAVYERLALYHLEGKTIPKRLEKSNIGEFLDEAKVIISAVDNLPTRELLWYYARANRVPLLSLGVSQQGTGNVEWTVGKYETWSMNPLGQKKKMESAENIPRELKPCELIAFRGLGLNVAIAAAKALGIWFGWDPEKQVVETLGVDVLPNTASTWSATNTGHQLVEMKELIEEEVFSGKA